MLHCMDELNLTLNERRQSQRSIYYMVNFYNMTWRKTRGEGLFYRNSPGLTTGLHQLSRVSTQGQTNIGRGKGKVFRNRLIWTQFMTKATRQSMGKDGLFKNTASSEWISLASFSATLSVLGWVALLCQTTEYYQPLRKCTLTPWARTSHNWSSG